MPVLAVLEETEGMGHARPEGPSEGILRVVAPRQHERHHVWHDQSRRLVLEDPSRQADGIAVVVAAAGPCRPPVRRRRRTVVEARAREAVDARLEIRDDGPRGDGAHPIRVPAAILKTRIYGFTGA